MIDSRTKADDEFLRVYDGDGEPSGGWLVRRNTINNMDSTEEVLDRLGLLKKTWKPDYDHIGKFEIDRGQGVKMRISTVGEMRNRATDEYKRGGATQYKLLQYVDKG